MRANRVGARTLTPARVAAAIVLFAFGAGSGMLGSLFLPAPASGQAQPPRPRPAVSLQPVAAMHEAPVADCVGGPLRKRAAQVLVVGLPGATSADDPVAAGAMRLGVGGVFINDSNVVDALQVRALSDGLRAASTTPLLVTTDEESGRVSTFRTLIGATSSPRTLAATRSADEVRSYAADMGTRLAGLGMNADLAPVADLDAGLSSGVIGDRSFSADPMVASEYAGAFAAGLSDAGLLPVAKHFPGHGGTLLDVHKEGATIATPLEDLLARDVMPFVGLIEAGVPIVMVGHPTYLALDPDLPASLSPTSYRLLRDLGFKGVAMTDSIGMGAIHRRWKYPEAAVKAIVAGADAVLATDGTAAADMVDAITKAVRSGTLDEDRLDEAVARMLTLKGVDPETLTCGEAARVPALGRRSLLVRSSD